MLCLRSYGWFEAVSTFREERDAVGGHFAAGQDRLQDTDNYCSVKFQLKTVGLLPIPFGGQDTRRSSGGIAVYGAAGTGSQAGSINFCLG